MPALRRRLRRPDPPNRACRRTGEGASGSGLWPYQFFFLRSGLFGVGQEAVGVVELAALHREYDERIPGTRVLEIGLREVRVAIRVRVEDADQVESGRTRFFVCFEQVFGTQLIARALSA